MKLEVHIKKKHLVILVLVVVGLIGSGYVYASWANPASGVGHSLDELEPCGDGEILRMVGGSWTCGTVELDCYYDYATVSGGGQHSCNSGYIAVGAGAICPFAGPLHEIWPSGEDTWYMACTGATGNEKTYVFCCKVT